MDGGAGNDEVLFETAYAADSFILTASGTMAKVVIDATSTVTMNHIEHLNVATWAGHGDHERRHRQRHHPRLWNR